MKGMTFENYRVDNGNRAAYDYCRRAAALEYVSGRTVLLLGPESAGKSHLLWSVVKHVRASSARVGLALVMASEFPEQVRQLAVNPAPIQEGKPALLLVDELESFAEDAYVLEGVVKAFLANGHGVLLASAVHPDRLTNFSEAFRGLLCAGDVIEVRPVGPLLEEEAEELALLEALRAERDALELKLAQKANEAAELTQVKARLDEAMHQVEQLTLSLADANRFDALHDHHKLELGAVEAERDGYRQAVESLRVERDALERRLAERTAVAGEVEALRERLVSIETERSAQAHEAASSADVTRLRAALAASEEGRSEEAAQAAAELLALRAKLAQAQESAARANENDASLRDRINHLQAEMSEYRGGLEEARDLRRQLEESQAQAQLERAELSIAMRAAQELEGVVLAQQAAADAELAQLRGEVHALVATARLRGPVDNSAVEALQTELEEAQSRGAAFRRQMDQDHQRFEEETGQLRSENTELQTLVQNTLTEHGRAMVNLETLKARHRTLEYELDKQRKNNMLLTAEMEALRNEATTQVAQAMQQAGELESRSAAQQAALDVALTRGRSAAQQAATVAASLAMATTALSAVQADLAGIDLPAEEGSAGQDANAAPQPSLFDTAPFMRELASLPDGFDAPEPSADGSRPLHELVEEALAGDGPAQA